MHLGPSCPNRPVFSELRDIEMNTRVQGVLAPGANRSLVSGLVPLREKVDSHWVSLPGLAFHYLCQPPFLDVSMFPRRVSGTLTASPGESTYLRMC
jgi:hypothetical protein